MKIKQILIGSLLVIITNNTSAQVINTIAGIGTQGFSGDGGQASLCEFDYVEDVAIDASGNIYVADVLNNRIRKISTTGIITTVAGNGTSGFSGDGGAATSAQFNYPTSVTVDAVGNLYITDWFNKRIRKVNSTGVITTVAGNGGSGIDADGVAATSVVLSSPRKTAVDNAGNLYIADAMGHKIRKVNTSGIISTVAGTGNDGFSGDGGLATAAELNVPYGVSVDASGNLYITDNGTRIRKVNTAGVISTIAGTGGGGYSGDGGLATAAKLSGATNVAIASNGDLYIADRSMNVNVIRKITNATGIISTYAGNGTSGFSGDGGLPSLAQLASPTGVALDAAGNLYISDTDNARIRKVSKETSGLNELTNTKFTLSNPTPNPFHTSAIIVYELNTDADNVKFSVTDVLGKIIFHETVLSSLGKHTIQLNNYSVGLYYYTLTVDGISTTKKMIVN